MSIAEMKVELGELKDQRPILEKKRDDADKSYKIGLIGVLLGIPLLLAYGCGFILIIAGALAAITQYSKRNSATNELDQLNEQIKTLRREIAAKEDGNETAAPPTTE